MIANQCGSLHIITGPMFSGKSSTLIAVYNRINRASSLCFNHQLDCRYSEANEIMTHDLVSVTGSSIRHITDIRNHPDYHSTSHIFIDEIQFFSNIRDPILHMVEKDHKHVYLAGLLVDINRHLFGEVHTLLGCADSVDFRTATRCSLCEKEGLFSKSKKPANKIVEVGQADKYVVLCRCHYLNNKGI